MPSLSNMGGVGGGGSGLAGTGLSSGAGTSKTGGFTGNYDYNKVAMTLPKSFDFSSSFTITTTTAGMRLFYLANSHIFSN